ncbi:MAG: NFACT family protein [Anaerolineae bacterium]|nr:NFACT family protein [Anaerolineae bacterium]
MYVDYLTLACLRDQLDRLLGARVQQVLQPDPLSVGLELYAGGRFQLLLSAHPQYARVLLVPHKLRRGVEKETPLLLLLRKWVRGARLADITQPQWERVLSFHFEGRVGACCLVAEVMGRYSNVILIGPDGCVLDALKRVGPEVNRYRVTLPGRPYQPPPLPVARRPPTALTPTEWSALLASAAPDDSLAQLLTGRLLGVSPQVAREVALRATGSAATPARAANPLAVAAAIDELLAPLESKAVWRPHVALDEHGAVIAFAPYEPRQFQRIEATPHICEAMWRYFEQQLSADPYAAARQQVEELIDRARARLQRTLEQLQAQAVDEAQVEALREAGELLLAYQAQVPRGATSIALPDYTGRPRQIALDPLLTPVENAQEYFRRYHKAARAREEVATRVAQLTPDLAYLDQLAADLALAETRPEIDEVYEALLAAGWAPQQARPRSKQTGGPRRFEYEGFTIYVGRNARQNELITFEYASPADLWLHVRGLPGAHVLIKSGGRPVPEAVVQKAAALAAYYSPARGESRVGVDVTERRYVRRGDRPGLVSYRNERTVWVPAAVSGGSDHH